MQLSSTLCRAQEARHHALASATTLANPRAVAMLAAAAWAKEALSAEKREQRMARARADGAAGVPLHLAPTPPDERLLSENPDRGHANGASRPA